MYPSGRWRGYWEQDGLGRQTMRDLELRFESGAIQGQGSDAVGLFAFEGHYNSLGGIVLVKKYLGQHNVIYRGTYDGEGTIYGKWNIGPEWTGNFALFPDKKENNAESPILEVALPVKSIRM